MASQFDALDAALSASCLTAFGELATVQPRVAGRYTERAADPARPPVTLVGIYSAGPGETPIRGKTVGGEFQGATRFATMRAEFWIAADDAAFLTYPIAQGDLIILDERGGLPYEVVSSQRTDMGDINLILAFDDIPVANAPPLPEGNP